MMTRLYALLDPATGELRYIGKTKRSLWGRLCQHRGEALGRGKSAKLKWLRSLPFCRPRIELLDCVKGDGCAAERAMIGIARSLGARITNILDGAGA